MNTTINTHSSLRSWLGVNHLVNFASALKRKEYVESMNELMKTAIKWTIVGTVCMGVHKWTFRSPVYANQLHQNALQELNEWNFLFQEGSSNVQGISENSRLLIDDYFAQNTGFKRWPKAGKEYIEKCLESTSQAGSHSTRYFLEKGLENSDSGLIREIIKKCASPKSDTPSCLIAEEVFSKSKDAAEFLKKIVASCKTFDKSFCESARTQILSKAIEKQDLNQIARQCIHRNTDKICVEALKQLNHKLQEHSEEAWNLAGIIARSCKKDVQDLCKTARGKAIAETVVYKSWPDILNTIKSKCRVNAEGCSQLIEKASDKFLDEIKQDSFLNVDPWEIYRELEYNERQDNPSKISIALTLGNACVTIPTPKSIKNANLIVDFLNKSKKAIQLEYSVYRDAVMAILEPQIVAIRDKIETLSKISSEAHSVKKEDDGKAENQNSDHKKTHNDPCKHVTNLGKLLNTIAGPRVLATAARLEGNNLDPEEIASCTFNSF